MAGSSALTELTVPSCHLLHNHHPQSPTPDASAGPSIAVALRRRRCSLNSRATREFKGCRRRRRRHPPSRDETTHRVQSAPSSDVLRNVLGPAVSCSVFTALGASTTFPSLSRTRTASRDTLFYAMLADILVPGSKASMAPVPATTTSKILAISRARCVGGRRPERRPCRSHVFNACMVSGLI